VRKASSNFQRELQVPPGLATAVVIGKSGRTIRSFQNTPGISSVRLSSGKVEIRGHSEEAVQGVAFDIERLVCSAVAKRKGYCPDFFVTCFCKSLAEPLLSVNKICFEKFSGETSSYHRDRATRSYFCFKSGMRCEGRSSTFESDELMQSKSELSHDIDSLSAEFSSKICVSENVVSSHWDFSAYKAKLLPCLQFLRSQEQETTRAIKLMIRFGKQLFDGPNLCDQFHNGGFVSLAHLQELFRGRRLNYFFSTACSKMVVTDLRLQLEHTEYVKVSSRKKISLQVADLEDLEEEHPQRFNVSIRCDDNQGSLHNSELKRIFGAKDYFQVLDVDRGASEHELERAYRRCLIRIQFDNGATSENAVRVAEEAYVNLLDPARRDRYLRKTVEAGEPAMLNPSSRSPTSSEQRAVITRIRGLPKRHGFVTFCREGRTTTDFRLAVVTHEADLNNIRPEMVQLVDQAWRDRTPDQLLVFPPPGRFLAINIRYKETETYVTEDWKFRISKVGEADRTGMMENERWECGLSSRWFKWNDGITGSASMDSIVKTDVVALVKEAAKLSEAMCPSQRTGSYQE